MKKHTKASPVHYSLASTQVKQIDRDFAKQNLGVIMEKMGFGMDAGVAMDMAKAYGFPVDGFAMDSLQSNVTAAAIPGLVQFLQNWLVGQVYVMTAARKIDELIGISTQGEFSDEEVVQAVLEQTGYARPYSDTGNVPLSSFNPTFVPRTNVRFELGAQVGILESERNAKIRVNAGQVKRESCGLNLEITRNLVGFFGYNDGANNTYGFLNDPNLLPFETVAEGASGNTEWVDKTFLEIQADLLTMFADIRTQSKGNIDCRKMKTVLALPTNAIDYLSRSSDMGVTVWEWLAESYSMVRVDDAIQLDTATGNSVGDGGMYLYPETVSDQSTDDGRVWIQVVPQKFRLLGVQQLVKGYLEDYANSTAGAMCKRPWAVIRRSGIS